MRKILIALFIVTSLWAQNPNTACWPAAACTDNDLFVASNNLSQGGTIRLNGAINSAVTSFDVTSGSGFVAPVIITIDNEIIHCLTLTTNTLSSCTRGAQGTTAASHSDQTVVRGFVTAHHYNQVAAEIKALEANLNKRGTAAPASGDCDAAAEVGSLYSQSGNPATINLQLFRCTQTGAATYAWHPVSHLTGTTAPATCTIGAVFFDTDATAGQNWYGCTAADTWTLQGDGGGGGGITSLGGQTGATQTITRGAGIGGSSAANDHSFTTASSEADFLTSGALTCGASTQGKMQVHTTPLQYCDNAGTPALQYAAYGDSSGKATTGDSATAFFTAGQIEAARGGTGIDSSASSGIAQVASGTWSITAFTEYREFPAAVCQGAAPSSPFSLPTANPPTVTCVNNDAGDVTDVTAVSNYGTLSFANNGTAATSNVVQGKFQLPENWTGAIDLFVKWRSGTTTNDVVWQVQTMCVADGETSIQSTANDFNTADAFTADTAKGTANQWNDASKTGITTTGCAADEMFFFRFFRDATHASDSHAAAAELISLRFKLRRTF